MFLFWEKQKMREKTNLSMKMKNIATSTHTQKQTYTKDALEFGKKEADTTLQQWTCSRKVIGFTCVDSSKKLQRRSNEQHSLLPHGYHHHGTDYIVKEFGCAGQLPGYCNFMLFNLDK